MAEYVEAIGRRKEASARVRLYAGTGEIVVNDKPVDDYFGRALDQMILRQPLALTGTEATLNIGVEQGGGVPDGGRGGGGVHQLGERGVLRVGGQLDHALGVQVVAEVDLRTFHAVPGGRTDGGRRGGW